MYDIKKMRAPCRNSDRYLELDGGSFKLDDDFSRELEKLTSSQLKDRKLWSILVGQFKPDGVDDADLGWRCEYWGKMMRGACFTYRVSGDGELYDILEETVRDMLTAEDSLGRFSTYSVENEFRSWDIWGRKYIMLGMEYFLEICRDKALADMIVGALCRHADYMLSKLGREENGKICIAKATQNWDGLNSCSILEPFVLLYSLTGEERYMEFSEYILSFGGTYHTNLFRLAYEDRLPVSRYPETKAYEMISCFEGMAEYNKLKPSVKNTLALIRFGRRVLREEATVIGCLGCAFESFDYAAAEQFNEKHRGVMQETCVTVTWMKFLWQLFRITGEAEFMDAFEISAYNAMSAALKRHDHPEYNGGIPMPIHSYNPLRYDVRFKEVGGQKSITEHACYGCCVAISAAGYALRGLAAACADIDGNVAVNLWRRGSIKTPYLELATETDYPRSGYVKITVAHVAPSGERKTVSVRIPAWSGDGVHADNTVTVTHAGTAESFGARAGEYASVLPREGWSAGDTIEFTLNVKPRIIEPSDICPDTELEDRYAVASGPVVYAVDYAPEECGENEPFLTLADGGIKAVPPEESPVRCRYALSVPTAGGEKLLVDYASAGQEEEHRVTCWMKR